MIVVITWTTTEVHGVLNNEPATCIVQASLLIINVAATGFG